MNTYLWWITFPIILALTICLVMVSRLQQGILAYFITLFRHPRTAYFLLIIFAGAGIIVFRDIAAATNEAWILAFSCIAFAVHAYFCLCWSRLLLRRSRSNGLIVRPIAFYFLLVTATIQFAPFVLPGNASESYLAILTSTQRLTNFWHWAAGTTLLLYGVCCLSLFSYELVLALRRDIDRAERWFTYRCLSLLAVALVELLSSLPDLIGLIAYKITGSTALEDAWLLVPFPLELALIGAFALVLLYDKMLLGLYQRWYTWRAARQTTSLQPFFREVVALVPSENRPDPFTHLAHAPLSQRIYVIDLLNELRAILWETETYRQAERDNVLVTDMLPLTSVSFAEEVSLWRDYLTLPRLSLLIERYAHKPSPLGAVPPLPVKSVERQSRYYRRLAKAVMAQSKKGQDLRGHADA